MFSLKSKLFANAKVQLDRSIARAPEVQAAYDAQRQRLFERYGDQAPCPLCRDDAQQTIIETHGTMIIIVNDFPYAHFDGLPVAEHLMLLPKRHLHSFDQFDDQESHDYWQAYQQYSTAGYTTMTRAAGNQYRSVPGHVHTHLLKYHE